MVSRLRKTCNDHRNRGMVIITCDLIIIEGELRAWALPTVTPFEPYKAGADLVDSFMEKDE